MFDKKPVTLQANSSGSHFIWLPRFNSLSTTTTMGHFFLPSDSNSYFQIKTNGYISIQRK